LIAVTGYGVQNMKIRQDGLNAVEK